MRLRMWQLASTRPVAGDASCTCPSCLPVFGIADFPCQKSGLSAGASPAMRNSQTPTWWACDRSQQRRSCVVVRLALSEGNPDGCCLDGSPIPMQVGRGARTYLYIDCELVANPTHCYGFLRVPHIGRGRGTSWVPELAIEWCSGEARNTKATRTVDGGVRPWQGRRLE